MSKILIALITLFTVGFAQRTYAADFSQERHDAWETFTQHNIEGYTSYPAYGLLFDAGSCNLTSNDSCDYAVSEGAGYGLILAATQKDQATFDKIFAATEKWMWNGHSYDWKIATDGAKWGTNAATDADEDVAFALIMADQLQKSGVWSANSAYRAKAQVLINNIFDYMTENDYLYPGDVFGSPQELNLSYFAPAWYRVFDEYESTDHDWQGVIDKQYEILLRVAERYNGIIPDWCTENGDPTPTGRPYNMTYDAIRIPWRIGIDALWNSEPRAQEYLDKVFPTVLDVSGVTGIKMYDLSGNAVEWHNELSVAMWAAGVQGSSQDASIKEAFIDELRSFYNPSEKAFSAKDPDADWRYYNQALAQLGAATIDESLYNPLGKSQQQEVIHKVYKKIVHFQGRKILVKVARTGDRYVVSLFERSKKIQTVTGKKEQRFFKKKYSADSTLKHIRVRHHTLVLQHAGGMKKIIRLYLGVEAR
ncbi:MAG: hypothetical protein HYV32_05775 [Candidatus Kerfeldbacteria bacterium]|nr:hypothetical protein [Candidatus Kerfeldbacteria bacterium]